MNVFIIPSWYPHRCFPLEGSYVRDLAVFMAELRPSWNVAVSRWEQGRGFLSWSHFTRSPQCLLETFFDRSPKQFELRANACEINRPTPTWSERNRNGNREGLLRTNRQNFADARKRFGRIDLVHAHVSYPAGWLAMQLRRETGCPYVVTEHMGPFPVPVYAQPDGALPDFIREPLAQADERVAVSPTLADAIAAHGIPKPEAIPNPVDERLYRPAARPQRDRFVFFTLCGMERIKGIDDLLRAAASMLSQRSHDEASRIEFRLGGEGPLLGEYQALAKELALDRNVTWLGLLDRERSREEYGNCDCFVLPSHHESFGIVFVEAIAFGKPVIGTRCGGPEHIITAENGLLVEPRAPQELAEALATMYKGSSDYDPQRIREDFMARFSREAVVGRLEAVYRRALATSESRS